MRKVLIGIFVIFLITSCRSDTKQSNVNNEPILGRELIGQTYIYPNSIKIIDKYGSPQTLSGTNNVQWVAYFPKGNFTILEDKKTNIIQKVLNGKKPQ